MAKVASIVHEISDITEFRTCAISLVCYATFVIALNVFKIDAFILSKSWDPKVRKNASASTFEGIKNRAFLTSTLQSIVNAFMMVAGAIYLLQIHWDWFGMEGEFLMFNDDPTVFGLASILAGYFACDFAMSLIFHHYFQDTGMVLHHFIFLTCCLINLYYKRFAFQFIWLALGELSTPFVNFRWVLHLLGMKETKLYLLNAFVLSVLFIIARVFIYGAGLFHMLSMYHLLDDQAFCVRFVTPGFLCVGYVLNLYWSTKIFRGYYRLIYTKKRD